MNLFLHNIGDLNSEPPVYRNDSLISDEGERFDYVLANPPFGKKSSMTITNADGTQSKEDLTYNRQDFWTTTSNKQLNFVQHIRSILKIDGQAAVVVPDNVLFGRRGRRNGAQTPTGKLRCPYPTTLTNRYFLRPRGESQRIVLRQPSR